MAKPTWAAAPKNASISAAQVLEFRNLAKTVGESALQGRGQGLYMPERRRRYQVKRFTTIDDNLEAYAWDASDIVLFELSETDRNRLLSSVLTMAMGTRTTRGSGLLEVPIPENFPQRAREYVDNITQGPLIALEKWIGRLPESMQSNPEAFYSVEFWNSLEQIGQHLLMDNPVRKYVVHDPDWRKPTNAVILPETERIMVPLPYVLSVIASEDAPYSIRKGKVGLREKLPWNRDDAEHLGIVEQYVRSSGVLMSLRARRAEKHQQRFENPFQVTIADAAMWGITEQVFKQKSLDDIIQPMRTMYRYTPNRATEFEEIAERVMHNAEAIGVSLHISPTSLGNEEAAEIAKGLPALSAMQQKLDVWWNDCLTSDERVQFASEREEVKQLVSMMHAHHTAARKFDSFLYKLDKPRVRAEGDARNEGVLHLHDGKHLTGFENRMNQPDTGGTIFALVYQRKDILYDFIRTIGGLRVFGMIGLTDPAQIERASKYLEGPIDDVVRGNPTGKLAKIIGWETGMWAAKRVLRNLRDKQLYYNLFDGLRQVVVQGITNFPGLIRDAMTESDVPDNPSKYSLDVSSSAAYALRQIHFPYQRFDEEKLWTARHRLALDDAVREEDGIPFQASLGAINVRLKQWDDAKYFLGMAENWSKLAEKDGHEAHWRAFVHYQRSIMLGDKRMYLEQAQELVKSFDIAQQCTQVPLTPSAVSAESLEEHAVLYPMQYEDRLKHIYLLQRNEHTKKEAELLAAGTAHEIETILSMKEQYSHKPDAENRFILSDERKGSLETVKRKLARLSSIDDYAVRDVEPQNEAKENRASMHAEKKNNDRYAQSEHSSQKYVKEKGQTPAPEKRTAIIAPPPSRPSASVRSEYERQSAEASQPSSIDAVVSKATPQDDATVLDNYFRRRDPTYNPNDLPTSLNRIYETHK